MKLKPIVVLPEIPQDYFVYGANFDVDEPYISICRGFGDMEEKIPFPKAIAFYLSTHWCGSKKMHDLIESNAIRDTRTKIKEALGIED